MNTKPGMIKNKGMSMTHACNPSTVEVEGGKSESQTYHLLWGRPCLKSKTKACVCRHAFSSACAGFSALLYDLRQILSKVLGFLKQGLMSFRLISNQVFLPGLSSAGVKHVPTMLGLSSFCIYSVSMAMVHVQGQKTTFVELVFFLPLGGVQGCMESAFIH